MLCNTCKLYALVAEKTMEVVQMVENLNVAIAHCVPRVADGLPARTGDTVTETASSKHLRALAQFTVGEFLGDAVMGLLEASRATKIPSVALQIAIRACLASCCHYVVNFWQQVHRFERSAQELYRGLRQLGGSFSHCHSTDDLLKISLSSDAHHRRPVAGPKRIAS